MKSGRVGSGPDPGGSGRVGSEELDPGTTLVADQHAVNVQTRNGQDDSGTDEIACIDTSRFAKAIPGRQRLRRAGPSSQARAPSDKSEAWPAKSADKELDVESTAGRDECPMSEDDQ